MSKKREIVMAGICLFHLVHAGWAKRLKTSVVAFDLAQYFLSLNHDIITYLLTRMGFPAPMMELFKFYLVGWKPSTPGMGMPHQK